MKFSPVSECTYVDSTVISVNECIQKWPMEKKRSFVDDINSVCTQPSTGPRVDKILVIDEDERVRPHSASCPSTHYAHVHSTQRKWLSIDEDRGGLELLSQTDCTPITFTVKSINDTPPL